MPENRKKVVIVTAASSGLGAGTARDLAARGWNVVLFARSERVESMAGEIGGLAVRGDITCEDDLAALVGTAIDTFGRIDDLVLSTGNPAKGGLHDLTRRDWHEGLCLALLPLVSLTRLLVPVFSRAGSGSIVTISSHAATQPNVKFPISGPLRSRLEFYRMAAREHAHFGNRINPVMPGFIDNRAISEEWLARIPAGRYRTIDELTGVVEFLLSDASA
ncbi:SDR family oxidoreductase [Mesorhizobium sp. M1423]|uniref:SDR family oxidoreductase n=1 Tax=Mesorhizobium sp. M1423 TaxID=2957101 RepID=UPI0033382E17